MDKIKLTLFLLKFLFFLIFVSQKIQAQSLELNFEKGLKFNNIVPLEKNNEVIGYVAFFTDRIDDKLFVQFIAFDKKMKVIKSGTFNEKKFTTIEFKFNHAEILGDSLFINSCIGPGIINPSAASVLLVIPISYSFGFIGTIIYTAVLGHIADEKLQFIRIVDLKNNNDSTHQKRWHINQANLLSNKMSMTRNELSDRKSMYHLKAVEEGILAIEKPLTNKSNSNDKIILYDKKHNKIWMDSLQKNGIDNSFKFEQAVVFSNHTLINSSLYIEDYLIKNLLVSIDLRNNKRKKVKHFGIENNRGYNSFHFIKNNTSPSKLLLVAKRHMEKYHRKTQGIYLAYFDTLQNIASYKNIFFDELEKNNLFQFLQDNDRWHINKVCWHSNKIIVVLQRESIWGFSDLLFITMNDDFSNIKIKLQNQGTSVLPSVVGDSYLKDENLTVNVYTNELSLNFYQIQDIDGFIHIVSYNREIPYDKDFVIEGENALIIGEIDKRKNKLVLRRIDL